MHPLNTPDDIHKQHWIDDAKHNSITSIKALRDRMKYLIAVSHNLHLYTKYKDTAPSINDFYKHKDESHKHLNFPPPEVHRLRIPTPKSSQHHYHHLSIIQDTTWKDYECNHWTRNSTGGWAIPPPDMHGIDDNTTNHPKAFSID